MTPDPGTTDSGTAGDLLLRRVIGLTCEDLRGPELIGRIAELVAQAVDADVCFVHVVDRDAGELVLAGATAGFEHLAGTIRLRIGDGVAGWVAEHGEPVVVRDKWADPRYRYIPALRGEEFNSMLSVPLPRSRGRVVGVMNVHSRLPDRFHGEDVERLADVAGLVAGIAETAVLYDRLAIREEQLARFAARTIELQELDRRRIAGDIHDGISQRLVSAWYHLRAAGDLARDHPVAGELAATEALLSDALGEARRAIGGLRPAVLDDLGLSAGLRSLARSVPGVRVELDIDGCALAPHVETAIYRIAQEALQNVQKHAVASVVRVRLRCRGSESELGRGFDLGRGFELTITDDGIGFDTGAAAKATSYGIAGMHERTLLLGARLDLRSIPGRGTIVRVVLAPYDDL